jgi:amino acid adenylation domain-containing protein
MIGADKMYNVLEYLEQSAERFPDKIAVKDNKSECTYSELVNEAKRIGTELAGIISRREPVVIYATKSVRVLMNFFGVAYAGGFYVLVDPTFPKQRVQQIFGVLNPKVVITMDEYRESLKETGYEGLVLDVCATGKDVDEELLNNIRKTSVDTDPLYGIFTSGSTGNPKGVVVCHRSVIDFIDVFTDVFNITDADVIGNQAPFDFDVSVKDIYSAIKTGATLVIIPKEYFMFPNNVVDMLDDNNVTTLIWAVSALCLLNRLHGLKYKVPHAINKIMFSGEMMPVKQLNQWRAHYPEAMFVNLYGPTEITCNCTYHILDREYADDEKLPMGKAFPNERVFLLDDEDKEVTEPNVNGEICVAGTALALGYYNNPEQTARAFVNNPLNPYFPELIYRTGDLAYYDENGLFVFAGRKDFQIKHMGHRIELEEIDIALGSVCGVERTCTFFDEVKNKIVAFYVGDIDRAEIIQGMKAKVPDFMIPNVFMKVDEMPITKNGKIDRNALKEIYRGGK